MDKHTKNDLTVQAIKIVNHLKQRGYSHEKMLMITNMADVVILQDADLLDAIIKTLVELE